MNAQQAYEILSSATQYCMVRGAWRAEKLLDGLRMGLISQSSSGEIGIDADRNNANLNRWQYIRNLEKWSDWDRDAEMDALLTSEVAA